MSILKRKLPSGRIQLVVKGQLRGQKYWEAIPTGRISDAKLREAEIKKEILDKSYGRSKNTKTLREFIENDYLPHARSKLRSLRSVQYFLHCACEHLGNLPLRDITPKHIRQYIQHRETTITHKGTPRSAATVHREMGVLSAVFSLAVADEEVERNPCFGVRRPTPRPAKIEHLTYEEEARLLAFCIGERAHLRDIILVGTNTGLRPGPSELLGLRRDQIDFDANVITIAQHKTMHTGDLRIVPMNSVVREILLRLAIQRSAEQHIFLHPYTGKPLLSIKKAFKAACKLAGLPPEKSRPYTLRHTCLTRLAQAGVPITEIRAIAGHRTLQITERYLHSTQPRMQEAVEKLKQRIG